MFSTVATVLDNHEDLKRRMIAALIAKIALKYRDLENKLKRTFFEFFMEDLRASDTYRSLLAEGSQPTLAADFGFILGSEHAYLLPIEKELGNQVQTLEKSNAGYSADGTLYRVKVGFIEADFDKIISLNEGEFGSWYMSKTEGDETRGISAREEKVSWLEWLLLGGDIIKPGFIILHVSREKNSRSKEAIMIPNPRGWRVQPQHAGTLEDNWITRTLEKTREKLRVRMMVEMGKK
jgi:hypothetical protein